MCPPEYYLEGFKEGYEVGYEDGKADMEFYLSQILKELE